LNHCKEMGAEPGRRSLKMPAEKLGPVIVALVNLTIKENFSNVWLFWRNIDSSLHIRDSRWREKTSEDSGSIRTRVFSDSTRDSINVIRPQHWFPPWNQGTLQLIWCRIIVWNTTRQTYHYQIDNHTLPPTAIYSSKTDQLGTDLCIPTPA